MALMTRPPNEGPFDPPVARTPGIYRPPPEDTGPPLVPGVSPYRPPPEDTGPPLAPGAPAPPPVAPTSEMGAWIEEMIRQGQTSRVPGIATSVNPGGGLGYTGGYDLSGTGVAGEGGTDYVGTEQNPSRTPGTAPAPTQPGGARTPDGTTPAAGDLPYPGAPAWINSDVITPEERAWFIEHKYVPPPWAGDPTVPAVLSNWLRSYDSGQATMPQELYDYFGGDQILEAMRKYDPNARWSVEDLSGGEGGTGGRGLRLDFDERLMPASAGPMGWMKPTTVLSDTLHNPGMKYYDPIYGWVTDPRNQAHPMDKLDKWGPGVAAALITMVAPYAAPALFSALGAGAVAAGFTSAVTAGAAGLSAGSTPGSIFAAGAAGIPPGPAEMGPGAGSWSSGTPPISGSTARTLLGVPRTAGQLASQYVTPHTAGAPVRAPVTPAGVAAPAPPPVTTVTTQPTTRTPNPAAPTPYTPAAYTNPPATTRMPIARNQVMNDPYGAPQAKQQGVVTPKARGYDPYGFDPTAFNSGGSTTKPRSNDSKLVATQFADDPYRFS